MDGLCQPVVEIFFVTVVFDKVVDFWSLGVGV
jgi:hypothetical protein